MDKSHLRYPSSGWSIQEDRFNPATAAVCESLFAVGNGYIGIRGAPDEGYPERVVKAAPATFLNGVYESFPIHYEESAPGFARNNHSIVQVPDGCFFALLIDEEVLRLDGDSLCTREFDLAGGVLSREIEWESVGGKRIRVRFSRFASAVNSQLAVFHYEVQALNFTGPVVLHSGMGFHEVVAAANDPRASQNAPDLKLTLLDSRSGENCIAVRYRAPNSGIEIAVSLCHQLDGVIRPESIDDVEGYFGQRLQFDLVSGESREVSKYLCYADTLRHQNILAMVEKAGEQALSVAYRDHLTAHKRDWRQFWHAADIQVAGNYADQAALRFNLLHLRQSAGRDGWASIAAKGLSGSGYDGHFFWDAEIFVLPFFLYTEPARARGLLDYRIGHLHAARARAREMSHGKGALYAWRTIGGEECSAYFPAGTAQYHINADIAYASQAYFKATGDMAFLANGGAEMILETARIWPDIGAFCQNRGGRFCIFGVTGPDEYTAMVDNNYYTNVMARQHLQWAVEVAGLMEKTCADDWRRLVEKLDLSVGEIAFWQELAQRMYVPEADTRKVIPQDDAFLQKPLWDFANTPESHYPLLLHYHPLVIYRHQVCKQADVLLALLLQDSPEATLAGNFAYYEPITTHDSTLSSCVHSIAASLIGERNKARDYFQETLWTDLHDLHDNTYYGVHTACMGGVWMAVVYGFLGVRFTGEGIRLAPCLPENWQGCRLTLTYRGSTVEVAVGEENCVVRHSAGDPVAVTLFATRKLLKAGMSIQSTLE